MNRRSHPPYILILYFFKFYSNFSIVCLLVTRIQVMCVCVCVGGGGGGVRIYKYIFYLL